MRLSLMAARALFFLLFALVTFLTLTPDPDNTEPGFVVTRWISSALFGDDALADKVAHFLAYASLGALAFWAEVKVFSQRWGAWAALCLYGVLLEGLQGLGGVRDPEIADAVCNALGAAAGLGGAFLLSRLTGRFRLR
ncbi:VanZ family protein [Hyphococcus luteus]|uniref:VanZ-like domain-containing protein n=1 Tax=Hyphococcus luteus TaxID=2058213 RepID=A0A2S7KAR7_9PROT|nr:VanZ family protein [Marinicaulis flavus]PQA89614.1 hypothetical protein CW354_01750 [Marinicaulis flavus]